MSGTRVAVAALSLSAAGLVGIVLHEGYTDRPIQPLPGDKATIGFGTTSRPDGTPVQPGDRTTPPQALARALADVQKFDGALKQCIKVPLHQREYDAFLSKDCRDPANKCQGLVARRAEERARCEG